MTARKNVLYVLSTCCLWFGTEKYGLHFISIHAITGKYVPEEAVLDMKANFKLPPENDENFDYIEFIELPREKATPLVEQ